MKIKLDGLELNLTSEQVEDLKRQLEAKELPTTYEKAFESILQTYYIDTLGAISKYTFNCASSADRKQSHVPSEKHAKSVLAMCKLMTIAEDYNKRVQGKLKYKIDVKENGTLSMVQIGVHTTGNPMGFIKYEHAIHCMEHFKDLWNDFFML